MNYYRLALQNQQTTSWTWKSTVVTSLESVFQLLRIYRAFPQERLRVFSSTYKEDLLAHLPDRARNHLTVSSVPATEFLRARKLQTGEVRQPVPDRGPAEVSVHQSIAVAPVVSWQPSSKMIGSLGTHNGSRLERERLASETGPGGDHDLPYTFTLPDSLPQVIAWLRLFAQVRNSELQP